MVVPTIFPIWQLVHDLYFFDSSSATKKYPTSVIKAVIVAYLLKVIIEEIVSFSKEKSGVKSESIIKKSIFCTKLMK